MSTLLRRKMMSSGSMSITPQGNLIPYIRNTAQAYIDTGIAPDKETKVIVWARNFNPSAYGLFGSQVANQDNSFCVSTYTEKFIGDLRIDVGSNIVHSDDQFSNLSNYHKYELYHGELKVDDVTVVTTANSTITNNFPIHLFGMNRGGTHIGTGRYIDICAAKIYENDVLVRDFIPISTPSVGFLDLVSNTVFTNAGTGDLSYGVFDLNAYVPLQYITCTGQQYIDTGVYGTDSMLMIIKFYLDSTSVSQPSIFGTMTTGDASSMLLFQFNNAVKKGNFYINSTTAIAITNITTTTGLEKELTFVKTGTDAMLVRNSSKEFFNNKVAFTANSFVSPDTMYLGTLHLGGDGYTGGLINGRIYSAGFGSDRNFVPALVNNTAGLYDTYNDIFYPSASETSFIAGPLL